MNLFQNILNCRLNAFDGSAFPVDLMLLFEINLLQNIWFFEIVSFWEDLNKKIKDSDLPENVRIGAIVRGKQVMIPGGDFIFEKDDLVVLLASKDQLKEIENIFSIV